MRQNFWVRVLNPIVKAMIVFSICGRLSKKLNDVSADLYVVGSAVRNDQSFGVCCVDRLRSPPKVDVHGPANPRLICHKVGNG